MSYGVLVVVIAAILDYSIADPIGWLHPVQVMGWFISQLSQLAFKYCQTPLTQRIAGILLGLIVIIGSLLISLGITRIAHQLHPCFGIIIESVMLASCFAGKGLRNAANLVISPLIAGDIDQARTILRQYVGRDTENLSSAEIYRAVLETVTENATDGVTAPLFYAIVGLFIPAIGAVPMAFAYKASSTLDSMIGYRQPPYTYLGTFSAKLEDFFTWLPCRFTVLTLGLISLRPLQVWRICQRDAPNDPSPNSGWSECVYAAILGVQVGGKNTYRGVVKEKPLLGDNLRPITSDVIHQALDLTRICVLVWLGLLVIWKSDFLAKLSRF